MLSGKAEYKVDDLPIPASFISHRKKLKVWLEPVGVEHGADETVRRKPNTGLRIEFRDSRYNCINKKVLRKLMESKHYNNVGTGYWPDPADPSGFWRTLGFVQTEKVTIVVNAGQSPASWGDIDLKKLKESEGQKFEPLRVI